MNASQLNKRYTNKEGFKTLLWVFVGVISIMFFTQIMKLFKSVFGFISGSTSDEELSNKVDKQTNEVDALIKDSGFTATSLPRPISYYQTIANSCEGYMQGWGTNGSKMYELLYPLQANELKAVFKEFKSRINEDFGNDAGNLFTWFKWELSDYTPFDIGGLTKMRLLWKKTGLPITF